MAPKKKDAIDTTVKNISQIIVKAVKTKRQVENDKPLLFRNTIETPFAVGLGLYIHQQTRSKNIINTRSDLNLTIPYEKVLQIETEMANEITRNIAQNNGVYLPPNIVKGEPIHFAIDNIDFKNDTPDGKNEFHGTGQVVFQKSSEKERHHLTIKQSRNGSLTFQKDVLVPMLTCFQPNPPNEQFPSFDGIISCDDLELYKIWDNTWAVSSISNEKTPTWSAYNSLVTNALSTSVCQSLPLYPGSPTDWSNLYTFYLEQ